MVTDSQDPAPRGQPRGSDIRASQMRGATGTEGMF